MEAIILAGGLGTRLRQAVPNLPKSMAPVAGKPFMEILLALLAKKGFSRVVLSLGFMADKVVSYFGNRFAGMELVYEIEHTPLGTGGAVKQGLMRIKSDHAFVFNGDTYLDLEAAELENHWQSHRLPIIVAREVSDTARYGRLNTSEGRVLEFAGKGVSLPGLINAGCYLFPVSILDKSALGQPFSLEVDFLTKEVKLEHFAVFITNGFFIDIGVPADYKRAQSELSGTCN